MARARTRPGKHRRVRAAAARSPQAWTSIGARTRVPARRNCTTSRTSSASSRRSGIDGPPPTPRLGFAVPPREAGRAARDRLPGERAEAEPALARGRASPRPDARPSTRPRARRLRLFWSPGARGRSAPSGRRRQGRADSCGRPRGVPRRRPCATTTLPRAREGHRRDAMRSWAPTAARCTWRPRWASRSCASSGITDATGMAALGRAASRAAAAPRGTSRTSGVEEVREAFSALARETGLGR